MLNKTLKEEAFATRTSLVLADNTTTTVSANTTLLTVTSTTSNTTLPSSLMTIAGSPSDKNDSSSKISSPPTTTTSSTTSTTTPQPMTCIDGKCKGEACGNANYTSTLCHGGINMCVSEASGGNITDLVYRCANKATECDENKKLICCATANCNTYQAYLTATSPQHNGAPYFTGSLFCLLYVGTISLTLLLR